jgi:hypothetical protein
METTMRNSSGVSTATSIQSKPLAGSVVAGLVASLCCGGSLVFAAIGLGALYSALGLWQYIPQFLAAGTLVIVALHWLYYRRLVQRAGPTCDCAALRRTMCVSGALGLAVMVGSFVFLEWLNHAVVNAARFMSRPEYAQALIPGVPNQNLFYALLSFFVGLGLLYVLPLPARARASGEASPTEA